MNDDRHVLLTRIARDNQGTSVNFQCHIMIYLESILLAITVSKQVLYLGTPQKIAQRRMVFFSHHFRGLSCIIMYYHVIPCHTTVLWAKATVVAATYCSCLEMPRHKFLEALDKHPEDCRSGGIGCWDAKCIDMHRHASTFVRKRTISSSYNLRDLRDLRDLRMCYIYIYYDCDCWWLHFFSWNLWSTFIGLMHPLRISRISEPRLTRLHASKLATEQGTWRFLSKARVWPELLPGFSADVSELSWTIWNAVEASERLCHDCNPGMVEICEHVQPACSVVSSSPRLYYINLHSTRESSLLAKDIFAWLIITHAVPHGFAFFKGRLLSSTAC